MPQSNAAADPYQPLGSAPKDRQQTPRSVAATSIGPIVVSTFAQCTVRPLPPSFQSLAVMPLSFLSS